MKHRLQALFIILVLTVLPPLTGADDRQDLQRLIGRTDGVIAAGPRGTVLFEKNSTEQRIPASTLKILTALAILHQWGPDYRFSTEFYLDQSENLKVKGYGDPLLISEILADIAAALASRIARFNDLILDDSFFAHPIVIPGVNASFQPYDAPNGALCANFNTVDFRRTQSGGFESAEPQTPLLPFVMPRIRASALDHERIILSHRSRETTRYAGHLLRYFLNQAKIQSGGRLEIGRVDARTDRLILRYDSPFSLSQVIEKLLRFSNNFMANQMLIGAGAARFGAPGTLDKGTRTVLRYLEAELKTTAAAYVEGSGISRENRISPKTMLAVLEKFRPYHHLMRKDGNEYYKTGNLTGISTLAGYIEKKPGQLYPFVIMVNTPGRSSETIHRHIRRLIMDAAP